MDDLEDVDDILEFHDVAEILQARRHGRGRRIFRQRVDLFEEFTDQEFLERFRLSKECVTSLLDELWQYLPTSIDRRGLRISPRMQLLATLQYVATGDMQLTIADTADMSKASVFRCVQRVTRAIARIAPRHIKFPTPTEEIAEMQAFSRIAGMPGCIGCIDGTLQKSWWRSC
ncbi:putative nuclease HARBI1 [Chionoecetes opilio]|uniref:Putative nuclease HARBI1 n=1 Tax=Chionoecetes opilio TaxID=41210 RepID=A0A8J4Y9L8_CHIOP|nr:putative nuclease HARBI1 [Chionoecetes opilio]